MARILVIEDSPTNLELMVYLLEAFGHEPLTAADGEVGLNAVKHEAPDLIICDIHLPKVDGYEVARRLKSHPALREIPLIAVTALAMMGDRDKVLHAGFDGYIPKPITPESFVARVESYLRPHQRVNLHLPAEKSQGETGSLPSGGPTSRAATILVLDDRYENLDLLRAILEPSGYKVVTASTVRTALAAARASHPDLILSDVYLQGETGHDLIRVVKADPELRSIPFLFISSATWPDREGAGALAEGAANYITRPIEPQLLLAHIEKWLGRT